MQKTMTRRELRAAWRSRQAQRKTEEIARTNSWASMRWLRTFTELFGTADGSLDTKMMLVMAEEQRMALDEEESGKKCHLGTMRDDKSAFFQMPDIPFTAR